MAVSLIPSITPITKNETVEISCRMEHKTDIMIQQCYNVLSRKNVVMNNTNALSLLHDKLIVEQMVQPLFLVSEHWVRLKVNIDAVLFQYSIDTQ